MKKYRTSISKRLFINIFIIVLVFALVVILANTLLFRPLYQYYTSRNVDEAFAVLKEIDYTQALDEWAMAIHEIEQGNTFEILVIQDGSVVYSTSQQLNWTTRGKGVHDMIGPPRNSDYFNTQDIIKQGRTSGFTNNVIYRLANKDDYTVLIAQLMAPINNTIRQSNSVVVIVTLLFLIVTLIVAFRLSRKFTKPIKSMQKTLTDITNLNFEEITDVTTGDELEHLADDINVLSSRLKNTLKDLKIKNEQLEKDILSQRQFISNASHELRTPLSLIKGYAEEINNGFINSPEQQKLAVSIIGKEANKMNRMLKEMLELSRMESGRMTLQNEKLSVKQKIVDFVDKYDGYIAEKGIKIILQFEVENDTAQFDPMRFEQILANYLSNAAKYGDTTHSIKISTKDMEKCIRINLFNTGAPIAKTTLDHLWDRFYKNDDSQSADESSYGLGLSIVAAIQNLSGQAYGCNNADGGVDFWFDVKKV